jgi:ProP effector
MIFYPIPESCATENFAEAKEALDQALTAYPTLTPSGFAPNPDPFDLAAVASALAFLRTCTPAPTPSANSYSLKHSVESAVGHYVSNGAVIVAAHYLQLPIRPIPGTANASIGVSQQRFAQPTTTGKILERLAQRWPRCFSVYERKRKPLKVGIDGDLSAELAGEFSDQELRLAIGAYTANREYQRRLVEGATRIDLNGEPAGVVTRAQVDWARGARTTPTPTPKPTPKGDGLAALKAAAAARRAKGGGECPE